MTELEFHKEVQSQFEPNWFLAKIINSIGYSFSSLILDYKYLPEGETKRYFLFIIRLKSSLIYWNK